MIKHKGTETIETERLILRRFRLADAQAMYTNWASDDDVTRFLTWPSHSSPEISEWVLHDWVESYEKPDFYQWAITVKDQGDEPIGSISVVERNDPVGRAQVGYCIGKKWWGRGITPEALRGVADYLFDEVGFQRVEARHDVNNPNSGKVMQKAGMQYEGTLRRYDKNNQGVCDTCIYSLLADQR